MDPFNVLFICAVVLFLICLALVVLLDGALKREGLAAGDAREAELKVTLLTRRNIKLEADNARLLAENRNFNERVWDTSAGAATAPFPMPQWVRSQISEIRHLPETGDGS